MESLKVSLGFRVNYKMFLLLIYYVISFLFTKSIFTKIFSEGSPYYYIVSL
jgi:hypothetical protein